MRASGRLFRTLTRRTAVLDDVQPDPEIRRIARWWSWLRTTLRTWITGSKPTQVAGPHNTPRALPPSRCPAFESCVKPPLSLAQAKEAIPLAAARSALGFDEERLLLFSSPHSQEQKARRHEASMPHLGLGATLE